MSKVLLVAYLNLERILRVICSILQVRSIIQAFGNVNVSIWELWELYILCNLVWHVVSEINDIQEIFIDRIYLGGYPLEACLIAKPCLPPMLAVDLGQKGTEVMACICPSLDIAVCVILFL